MVFIMKKMIFLSVLLLCSCELNKDKIGEEDINQSNMLDSSKIDDIVYDQQTADIQSHSDTSLANDRKGVQYTKNQAIVKKKQAADINLEVDEDFVNIETPVNEFDCAALQMAGLYAPENFRKKKLFHDYAKFINKEWNRLESESLSLIEDWSRENITSHTGEPEYIFYPFGGPDIAYAFRFFPKAKDYVLVGLEPIGCFPAIKKNLEKLDIIDPLKTALTSYLRSGFFITSEMSTQLSHKGLRGTLYMLMLQLSKLGFEIHNIEDLSIDKNGQEVARDKNMADCVKISCVKKGETTMRHVYYIRLDLGNESSCLENLFNFVRKSSFTTFIKSASYALHDRSLSKFKKFILDNTTAILQDDTGVPFTDFGKNWKKYAFGTYTEPTLPIFKGYRQSSLVDFFKSNSPVSIPFKIGYGYNQGRPNLLMAVSLNKYALEDIRALKESQKQVNECKDCDDVSR